MNAILVKSVGTGIAATGDTDPLALYGDEIVFDVLRKGENVGTHTVRFDRKGRALFVESRFELAIKILFIPVYSFSYLSTARWRDEPRLEQVRIELCIRRPWACHALDTHRD